MVQYLESIASLQTRSEVRGFVARELDGLVRGEAQHGLPAELSDLATGSDREVIESYRRLEQSQGRHGPAGAVGPGAPVGHRIRDLFAKALKRMKELPPDPRQIPDAQAPMAANAAQSTAKRRTRR